MSSLHASLTELLRGCYADEESASQLCASVGVTLAPDAPAEEDDRWRRTVAALDGAQLDALFEAAARAHPELFTRANLEALAAANAHMVRAMERLKADDPAGAANELEPALARYDEVFGPFTSPTESILNALAIAYAESGAFTRAAQCYERARTMLEARLGDDAPPTLDVCYRLAQMLSEIGRAADADVLFRRVLRGLEAAPSCDEEVLASVLFERGCMLIDQSDFVRAVRPIRRALAIRERIFSPGEGPIIDCLCALASVEFYASRLDEAEGLYARSLRDFEARFGPDEPGSASILMRLGDCHRVRDDSEVALRLYTRALRLYEGAMGDGRRAHAAVLDRLAMLRLARGEPELAESLARDARAIVEAREASERQGFGQLSTDLAVIVVAQGRVAEAIPLLDEAIADAELTLRAMLPSTTTRRLSAYLEDSLDATDVALALALRGEPSAWRTALTATLLRKGRSLDEAASLAASSAPSDPAVRAKVESLRALRQELATRALAGPSDEAPSTHRDRLSALSDEAESLEQELADRSAQDRAARTPPPPDVLVDRVAAALARDSALIEFALAEPWEFDARRNRLASDEQRYLAMVLHPDASGESVDLGPSTVIDAAVSRMLEALAPEDPLADGAEALARDAAIALHALVMEPLEGALRGKRRVLLSLDGALWNVPFAALHDGASHLIDRFDIAYLSSGRDLVLRRQSAPSTGAVTAFADPDFSALVGHRPRGAKRRALTRALEFAELPRLPGTRREVESIARCFPHATIFTDAAATASALLAVEAPALLHVATHGFFLDERGAPSGSRNAVVVDDDASEHAADEALDPLLRSALVMAGARASSGDDAIATALEVAGMNLRGTQLVVFSACDTGRGEVRARDGVYGLRRAVFLAGAESLVMSLWQVDDDATSALMTDYYARLSRGEERSRALRDASLTVRETRPHPYYWAPFAHMGRGDALRLDAAVRGESRAAPSP